MYALVHLQRFIADRLGLPCGSYTNISLVPHIYYRRDINDLEPFCGKGTLIKPVREVVRMRQMQVKNRIFLTCRQLNQSG